MTAATAYSTTMTELRGEPGQGNLWSNYGSATHVPNRMSGSLESGFPSSAPTTTQTVRPRSGHAHLDHHVYSYNRYPQEEADHYVRQPAATLPNPQAYSGMKRSFSQTEAPAYQEIVQDLRDENSRLNMSQDHKLLAFRKTADKNTVVDQQGRMHQLELSAQLHGMFFLSEMPANASDGSTLQPELTCYRRNLFQISGSLVTPRGPLSMINESGETVAISSMEVTISAIESVDGNAVRLIVIPWKTPPPNSPEVQNPDQEPSPLPLIPFQDETTEADGEYAVYPVGWRRLQFRIATANNGRRKELQQHFVLHLKVMGTLADNSKVALTESTTAPIVVRGRSPRNFQTRKEIPLLGSSAGSRGQALVETGLGVVAGGMAVKPQDVKPRDVNVPAPPRGAFNFSPTKSAGATQGPIRSHGHYPNWNSPNGNGVTQMPASHSSAYPSTSMASDSYPKLPYSNNSNFNNESQELTIPPVMPPPGSLGLDSHESSQGPMRPQYTYVQPSASSSAPLSAGSNAHHGSENPMSVPRYIDNARPNKRARHDGQQSVTNSASGASDAASDYRYGNYPPLPPPSHGSSENFAHPTYNGENGQESGQGRDFYHQPGNWAATSAAEPSSSVAYADSRPYAYPTDQYKNGSTTSPIVKPEPSQQGAGPVYGSAPRQSYEAVNNYSWGGS